MFMELRDYEGSGMKYSKVMFVIPKVQASYSGRLNPHLGVAYLAAVLKEKGVNVKVFDFSLDYNFEEFLNRVKDFKPDLIGVSLFSFDFVNSYKLIDRIKENCDCIVAIGGVHVAAVKEKVLEKTKADVAFYGEAEVSFVELCAGKEYSEIKGLIHRNDGKVVVNEPMPYIRELDSIPFPDYDVFEINKYVYPKEGRLQIATSRGCPYGCVYCAVRKSMGRGFRPRSAENVIKELELRVKGGCKFFEFVDDCFTMDMDRAKKVCDMIIEKDLGIRWNCANGIRADRVDEELLNKMKTAGCVFVCYGMETGNREVLKKIGKGLDFDKALDTFELTKKVGLKFGVNFIIGHPDETFEKAMDSIKLARLIPADYVNFSNMVPYPGTEVYEYVKEHGIFLLPEETYLTESTTKLGLPVFETQEFSYKERVKALNLGRAIAKKTHLQYRLGKVVGGIVYQFVKSDKMYNLMRRVATGKGVGKRVYDALRKS